MRKTDIVTLTEEERRMLQEVLCRGKAAARKLMHARVLLKTDAAAGGPGWNDESIAETMEVRRATVERVRNEAKAWDKGRNNTGVNVNWQFTIANASQSIALASSLG